MTGLQDGLPTLPSSSRDLFQGEGIHPLFDGEPVITSGRDVSQYLVDLRDDEDPPFTFRSIVLGTMIGGLGAALYQIYIFKPIQSGISTVDSWVKGTRFEWLGPALHFINPGQFRLKEHVTATIITSSASWGSTAVLNFAVQRLYYDTKVTASTAILSTFSTAVFGLRDRRESVYWSSLPTVSIFQALHFDNDSNHKRMLPFWTGIFCLASRHASPRVQDVFTNIFGGADGNEGLGLFSLSFDWQYIGSTYMSLPLIQQANSWIGIFICYIAIAAILLLEYVECKCTINLLPWKYLILFSRNLSLCSLRRSSLPMVPSTTKLPVFTGPNFQLNQTALDEIGLPALTGSNVWAGLMGSLAIGGLIAHCVFFWGPSVVSSLKHSRDKTQPDPHWVTMQKYEEAPWWWYTLLLLLAFFAGLISVLKGQTTLPVWSYISRAHLRRDRGPVLDASGCPHGKRYCHQVGFSIDLKMGQYLKIPPRALFVAQAPLSTTWLWFPLPAAQRDLLLDPTGNNIWNGQTVQSLNSHAITWSLAKELYGPSGPYFVIPMGIFIGFAATVIHWFINKRWPYIGPVRVDRVILPLIFQYSSATLAVTSVALSTVIVGLVSQFWLRRYHPGWYRKYNYILGGALDGGAQVMIFILSFTVFGASGVSRPVPHREWGPIFLAVLAIGGLALTAGCPSGPEIQPKGTLTTATEMVL
ncbi:OPT oligopeptide transporter protein-domain-containing protein [Lactarius indigo]|nr:OPT oligopeptide transporter protein-domain-containing protein [Lactarius indigo]